MPRNVDNKELHTMFVVYYFLCAVDKANIFVK